MWILSRHYIATNHYIVQTTNKWPGNAVSSTLERNGGGLVVPVPPDDPFDDFDIPDDPLADLDRATQKLTIRTDERRYGKKMVVVEGFDSDTDIDALASTLKSKLGTGGTAKTDRIELQGDHEERVRALLAEMGYQFNG